MRRRRVLLALLPSLLIAAQALASPVSAPSRGATPTAEERATKDDYGLDTSGTVSNLKVGESGAFSLVITPKNGKKVHPDAPLEVTFKDAKGVKPAKQKLGRGDVADKAAKAPLVKTTLAGEKAGAHTLEANVSFFLCTDSWCQRMSDKISVAVTVE